MTTKRNNDAQRVPRPRHVTRGRGPEPEAPPRPTNPLRALVTIMGRMPFSSLMSQELGNLRRALNVDTHQRGEPVDADAALPAITTYLEKLSVALEGVARGLDDDRETLRHLDSALQGAAWIAERITDAIDAGRGPDRPDDVDDGS